jgi:hypothetical protein
LYLILRLLMPVRSISRAAVGHPFAALGGGGAQFVERGVPAVAEKAALFDLHGRLGDEARFESRRRGR